MEKRGTDWEMISRARGKFGEACRNGKLHGVRGGKKPRPGSVRSVWDRKSFIERVDRKLDPAKTLASGHSGHVPINVEIVQGNIEIIDKKRETLSKMGIITTFEILSSYEKEYYHNIH